MKKVVTLVLMIGLAAVLIAAGCAPQQPAATVSPAPKAASGPPIKFGYLRPITGFAANLGLMQQIGAGLAMEDVNARGGINGSPLEVIMYDSPFNPKDAGTLTRKLAQEDKAFAIFGPFSSGEFEVAAPLGNELKIPVINASSAKPGITEANRPWAFRIQPSDDISIPPLVKKFMEKYPKVKRVAVIGDVKEAVSQYVTQTLYPKVLKDNNLEVVDIITFGTGDKDLSAQVTRLKGLKPDAVAVSAQPDGSALLAKEMDRQEVRVPVMTGMTNFGGAFLFLSGAQGEGWMVPGGFWQDSPDPQIRSVVSRFVERAKAEKLPTAENVTQLEMQVYDAIMFTAEVAAKKNLKPDTPVDQARAAIRDGWENMKGYKGVTGVHDMTKSGDTTYDVFIFANEKGKWQLVK